MHEETVPVSGRQVAQAVQSFTEPPTRRGVCTVERGKGV